MGGWISKIVSGVLVTLLKDLAAVIWFYFQEWFRKYQREKNQEKARDNFENVVNDPNSDINERIKAHEDYLNSGPNRSN